MVSGMSRFHGGGRTVEKFKVIKNTPNINNDIYRRAHGWISNKAVILGEVNKGADS